MARVICLSNNIKSAGKEKVAEDFHNELLLLQMQTGYSESVVLNYAERQIQGFFDQIFNLVELDRG